MRLRVCDSALTAKKLKLPSRRFSARPNRRLELALVAWGRRDLDGDGGALAGGAVEAEFFEGFIDLFEGLVAEVGDAQEPVGRTVEQIADGEDATFFEAVGGANGEADLGGAHLQTLLHEAGLFVLTAEWNAGTAHGIPPWV